MPIIQTREICKQVKVEQTTPRVLFQSLQTGPSKPRHSGRTSHVPGFHWHVFAISIANTVLETLLLGGGMWKDCQPFRMPSHVHYTMHVMIAAFTRSCSTLRPQAHENTRSYVYLHTDRAFLISPSKGMPVGKRGSMHWGGCAKVFRGASRLSESEHGPLVTDISLLGHDYLANAISVLVSHQIMIFLRPT
jgi:hypothetical protein